MEKPNNNQKQPRSMSFERAKTATGEGKLKHDKDVVLTDIIYKIYKELWTTISVIEFIRDYHNVGKAYAKTLVVEARQMFYETLKDIKSDIFLDCYHTMTLVAQKAMENGDYRLVLESTKEIAKLHHLYEENASTQEKVEQPLFAPPQKVIDAIDISATDITNLKK